MEQPARRGPKSSVTVTIDKYELKAADGNIKQLFKSEVRPFAKSGAYIPISDQYRNHKVFIVVLEK